MRSGKVIGLVNANENMKNKIAEAKQRAEAELQQKIEMSKRSDIDVREVFTPDDFDAICQQNEFFAGKLADLSKAQRHKKLTLAAKWLNANSIEILSAEVEPVSQSHPNAIVTLEMRRIASLKGQELRAFTAMSALADTAFISSVKDSTIRFTFGIEEVWGQ